jgi:hypothetical protein
VVHSTILAVLGYIVVNGAVTNKDLKGNGRDPIIVLSQHLPEKKTKKIIIIPDGRCHDRGSIQALSLYKSRELPLH